MEMPYGSHKKKGRGKMSITLAQAKEKLKKYGQEHVLKYYDELSAAGQAALLEQIGGSDMDILDSCKHQEAD